jgi:hypothetical protein
MHTTADNFKVTSFGLRPGHNQTYALFKHMKKPHSRPYISPS